MVSKVCKDGHIMEKERYDKRVRIYGDPVLRKKTEAARHDEKGLQKILKLMNEVIDKTEGVGLAANQVGISKKIILINLEEYHKLPRFFLLNPEVAFAGESTDEDEEGCLSVPGVSAPVKRSSEIIVKGADLSGRQTEIKADKLLARVLQHEIDHLNGILFVNRLSEDDFRKLRPVLKELQKEAKKKK